MRTPSKSATTTRLRAQRNLAKNRRSRVSMVVILLVLLLTTGLLSRFGVEDFSGALTFPGRITGAVLIVVAFTTLLGAAAVVDHWVWHSFPYSGLVALIGAFAALLTNILLLADILKNGDSVAYPVLVGALTAGSAWAVFAVWRTSVVIPAPKRVAAALILSSVIAIANFGYQNLYQPSQHEVRPVIKLTTGNPVTSQDHKAFSVPVDITLENRNDARFYVLGTEFHAMAQRVPLSSKDRLRQQWRADAEQWTKYQEINPLSRREIHQPGELIEAQPWLPTGQWIEANDTFSTRMVVQLPMDTPYDQVAFYASASLAHKDRVILKQIDFQGYSWRGGKVPPWMNTKETDSLIYRGRLHENNAIDEHTRVPRFVTVYWTFGAQGAGIRETITRHGSEDHTQAELVSRYGLVDVLTGPIERTLWDIKSRR
ncbi:hypothetical protein [Streptomyces colonosanans]|uniref:hypothetical protein n=1 Tax=Streptomyces colonosanans TaxID=1428652 RepID=UPI000B143931|nr:hypothetical protein [Streptomyces colonosanans]